MQNRFLRASKKFFYIDLRSLAAFRAGISLVIIWDLFIRFTDLKAHYTSEGVLPLQTLLSFEWNQWYWSLANISDAWYFQFFLFSSVFISALLLLVGYKARIITIICWAGLLSIQNRNPVIFQGGDDLLRMLLLWSIFLPLGAKFSISKIKEKTRSVSNVFTMAILLQVLMVYLFSALMKSNWEWWHEGSAIFYAMSLDQIARPPGLWLAENYELSRFLTKTSFLLELLILPLFFFPFKRELVRGFTFLLLFTFNIGIEMTMMIGLFPKVFLAASLLFLPTSFWKWTWNFEKIKTFKSKAAKKLHLSYFKKNITQNHLQPKWPVQALGLMILIIIILWNLSTVRQVHFQPPGFIHPFVYALRLNQSWGMFAPTVFKEDGWYVLEAELRKGNKIDLLNPEKKLSFEKPGYVLNRIPNDRWRKYGEQVLMANRAHLRQFYCDYLISSWNRKQQNPEKMIRNLRIIYIKELSRPFGEPLTTEKVILHECLSGSPIEKRRSKGVMAVPNKKTQNPTNNSN